MYWFYNDNMIKFVCLTASLIIKNLVCNIYFLYVCVEISKYVEIYEKSYTETTYPTSNAFSKYCALRYAISVLYVNYTI